MSSFSTSLRKDYGFDDPKRSELARSLSYALKTRPLPERTCYSICGRQKFSFHSAALPASSFTSVSTSFPLYRNLIYGSYLPKVSASFRKVAETIVKSSMHLAFKRGFGGGSGYFQINCVVNLMWPVFLNSWKRSIAKVLGF